MTADVEGPAREYEGNYDRDRAKGIAFAWVLSVAVGTACVTGWYFVPRLLFWDWPFRRTATFVSTLVCVLATTYGLKYIGFFRWQDAGNRAGRWKHNRELVRIVGDGELDAAAVRRARRHIHELRRYGGKAEGDEWERTLGLGK